MHTQKHFLNTQHVQTMLSQVQSIARVSFFFSEEDYSSLENALMIRPESAGEFDIKDSKTRRADLVFCVRGRRLYCLAKVKQQLF